MAKAGFPGRIDIIMNTSAEIPISTGIKSIKRRKMKPSMGVYRLVAELK
jgi:hypothetical protein